MSGVAAGDAFGPYRVLAPLGKGGMGEVYIASDERLGRRVALKILPDSHAGDPSRRARFIAEARAASALQHPNIVTIFDIGHENGRDYFAMELLDGSSLRALLRKGLLPRERALAIAADVAAALAAAHASGIIHRDIKPENIIVMPSGQAKVLDYGLAKLTDRTQSDDSPTIPMASVAGAITGTVAYMSPEQASGETVDHRTDIFSLGTVLYEMLSGRQPFVAKSAIDQLHKIINAEPEPIRQVNPSVPAPVVEILEKAMAKDRDWRYASAADLRLDLLRVLRAPPEDTSISTPLRDRAWMFAIPLMLLLAAMAFMLIRQTAKQVRPPSIGDVRLIPLTNDGMYAGEPTFSPDGSTIAYVSDKSGNLEIYLKQVTGGSAINLTNHPADDVQPSFSPDGKEIAFVSSRASAAPLVFPNARSPLIGGDVWVMPAFGGAARRVAMQGNFPSWTRDGKSLLFTSGPWSGQKIHRVSALGGSPAEIPIRFAQRHLFIFKPQESPDGKWIVFGTQEETIYVTPAKGGDAKLIGRGWEPAWKPDGAVVFSRTDRNETLWEVRIDSKTGAPLESKPVTVGRGRDAQPAISANGRMIALSGQQVSFNIERIRFDSENGKLEGSPEVVTHGPGLKMFFDISPDQKSLVYQARDGAAVHLWRQDAGKDPVQLTSDPEWSDRFPAWSPDGSLIAFVRNKADADIGGSMWVMRADGSAPRMILPNNANFVTWTHDGRGLCSQLQAGGKLNVVDIATGTSRTLVIDPRVRSNQRFSPDGQWLIFGMLGVNGSTDLGAVPVSGGVPRIVLSTPRDDFHPFVSPSGRWLYAMVDHKNLVRVPGPAQGWRKAAPDQVTFFPETNLMLEDSRPTLDGKWLYYARKTIVSDIWVMTRTDGSAF